jgi:predicted nucleotidyltransferase component of viral defense system
MMDVKLLRHLAARAGLSLNYVSKDHRLSLILAQLDPLFGADIALKGGTALNRIHLSKKGTARFSEDIDLDFLPSGDLNGKISAISRKMERMTGFEVERGRLLHKTLRFDCRFTNDLGTRDRVMVEFNLSEGPGAMAERVLIASPFTEVAACQLNTLSIECLLAGKFMALHDRTSGKDIYDVYYGLQTSFDKKTLLRAIDDRRMFLQMDEGFFGTVVAKLEEVDPNQARDQTNHYIPKHLRTNWGDLTRSLRTKIEVELAPYD